MSIKIGNNTLKVGDFLRKSEEPYFIEILAFTSVNHRNLGESIATTFRVNNLKTATTHIVEKVNEARFKIDFKGSDIISKAEADALLRTALQPIPEAEQDKLVEAFKLQLKKQDMRQADILLTEYFHRVIARQPERIDVFFRLRASIRSKRYRTCICLDDLTKEVRDTFFQRLPNNVLDHIPNDLHAKPRRLPNYADYEPDAEDAKLQKLITPFVSTDNLRIAMMGVAFEEHSIAATDAHLLLYLPHSNLHQKGVYCMTRKCFKENEGKHLVDSKYPNYRAILPQKGQEYEGFELPIQELRTLIMTLEKNGLVNEQKQVNLNILYSNRQKRARFNASKKLLIGIEAIGKLGHSHCKIWLRKHDEAAILTPPETTLSELYTHRQPTILVMPLYSGETWEEYARELSIGSLMLDLEERIYWFYEGGDLSKATKVKPLVLKTEEVRPKANSSAKIKLAKAKAVAQTQRIRILELESA